MMSKFRDKHCRTEASIPYVISWSWFWRGFAIAYGIFIIWLFFAPHEGYAQPVCIVVWNRHGWLTRIGIVGSLLLVPIGLLENFVEKVIFETVVIRRRNMLGRWRQYDYDAVVSLDFIPKESLRITFKDGRNWKIFSSMANLETVRAILCEKNPGIEVDVRE
jgi:hypothetical protein